MNRWFTSLALLGLSGTLLVGCNNQGEGEDEQGTDEKEEQEAEQVSNDAMPKNVIMMIGDGMAAGQMEVARLLEHGMEGELHMAELTDAAWMNTFSNDHWATDSAAGGTAISSSTKTDNGRAGTGPDGEPLDSVADLFKENGKSVGLISNNTVTDATPASFGASVDHRSETPGIARHLFENEYDVLLGGGKGDFIPENQGGNDLIQEFIDEGYAFVEDRDELLAEEDTEKLLGLFHPSFMNYKTDYDLYDSNEPSLNEMTEIALDSLSQNEDGFFLMVEGARIDHASHAADFTNIWQETIEFDYTVGDVMDWAEGRDDTLVVVLADHETMGVAASETMDKEGLREVSASPEYMVNQMEFDDEAGEYASESVKSVVEEYAGVSLTDEEIANFNEYIYNQEGELLLPHEQAWELGSFIARHYGAGVMDREIRANSYETGGHTGNMVPIFADGIGSESFNGVMDNTDVVQRIAELAELDYEPGEIIE
ncbi:alkaline phosphatase [Texcoconibacillus texcoconensis]|uniref:Alkaline phosphatase n=1 Tax=Texcoconibacillus texcoconensis TaxID=1095777 RepID=A0A840QRV1_9BACI|nr:alkaline phosphatase [Texcoconibacillus texcoconensis]MBB5174053.1 alkaline phosphatase [Texcoconibacillus texcoconensis]